MRQDRRPSPDGDQRPTGGGDPYLGDPAHQSYVAADEGPSVTPDCSVGLTVSACGSDTISAYDPYLAAGARSFAPDF